MFDLITFFSIYSITGYSNVVLVEITINESYDRIDLMEFTQSIIGVDKLNWQVPYGEKYLNLEGTEIIGDDLELPFHKLKPTRIAFFFHELNMSQKFETPFGELQLPKLEPLPERLKGLINYESVN